MTDEPLWQKAYRGEIKPDDLPPPNPAHMDACEVCGVKAAVQKNGRIEILHDATKHGIGPEGTVTVRPPEPLALPRRVSWDNRRDIFGDDT